MTKKKGIAVKKVKVARKKAPVNGVKAKGLDAYASAYRRLLTDPCSADMVQPVTNSVGSGQLVRCRNFVNPGPDARDSVIQLFSRFTHWNGTANTQPYILFASANQAGTMPQNIYEVVANPTVEAARARRLVAGCIKVHYTGSEVNRAGIVSGNLATVPTLGAVGTHPVPVIYELQTQHPHVVRLGEAKHEYKWAPLDEEDEDFFSGPTDMNPPQSWYPGGVNGTALSVCVQNAYPGSILYEVVTVWELQHGSGGVTGPSGIVTSVRTDYSSSTRKNVLQSLGSVMDWFHGGGADRMVQRIGGYVATATKVGAALATVL